MTHSCVVDDQFLVSVIILAYNGEKNIKDCLCSVFSQTYDNIEIIVVDNASEDMTISAAQDARREAQSHSANFKIIKNEINIGFAGYNVGIKASSGEFVLCANQDAILDKDFISEAIKIFERDEMIGTAQGKILLKDTKDKIQNTNIIDTTGIVAFKSRRFVDRGQGEKDNGQYEKIEEVFGCNGAVAFYRKKCLEDIKIEIPNSQFPVPSSQFYDPDFFMYKEDIDLSWRIRLYGWKIMYCPKAIAHVDRTSAIINERSGKIAEVMKARRQQSQFVKSLSFKNYRLAMIKNELPTLLFRHLPWILLREIGSWLYILFFEPKTWPAVIKLFKQMPGAWEKRKIIMKNRKAGAKEMKRWFI